MKSVSAAFSFHYPFHFEGLRQTVVTGSHLQAQPALLNPRLRLRAGRRELGTGREGARTQEPQSSGLQNLMVSPGRRDLPSDRKQPQPRMQEEMTAEQRKIGSPRPGRGQGEVTQLTPPGLLGGARTTSGGCGSLPLCPAGGIATPLITF